MPTILVVRGYRLFFYSNEGTPREPPHVHVRRASGEAKVWLEPLAFASHAGFNRGELREVESMVRDAVGLIVERWNEYFDS